MNIYVGNLAFNVTDADLRQAFETFGEVASATVATDEFGTFSRGFGFVEMPDEAQAQEAIRGLNRRELKGCMLSLNEARPSSAADCGQSESGSRKPSRS